MRQKRTTIKPTEIKKKIESFLRSVNSREGASLVAQTVKNLPVMRENPDPWVGKMP